MENDVHLLLVTFRIYGPCFHVIRNQKAQGAGFKAQGEQQKCETVETGCAAL
jgi:hypothetical protein